MNKTYKRQYRELSPEIKAKMSAAQKNKKKSASHRLHLSQAMSQYWANIPHRPDSGNVTTYQGEGDSKNNTSNTNSNDNI